MSNVQCVMLNVQFRSEEAHGSHLSIGHSWSRDTMKQSAEAAHAPWQALVPDGMSRDVLEALVGTPSAT